MGNTSRVRDTRRGDPLLEMGTTTNAPSPPPSSRPAATVKFHLEKEGVSFSAEAHSGSFGSLSTSSPARSLLRSGGWCAAGWPIGIGEGRASPEGRRQHTGGGGSGGAPTLSSTRFCGDASTLFPLLQWWWRSRNQWRIWGGRWCWRRQWRSSTRHKQGRRPFPCYNTSFPEVVVVVVVVGNFASQRTQRGSCGSRRVLPRPVPARSSSATKMPHCLSRCDLSEAALTTALIRSFPGPRVAAAAASPHWWKKKDYFLSHKTTAPH
ncbi:hypothetical protein Taro_041655 [Colocasia esculenta]|uniref:Uncharacterized protein n=1 Tax=Colocasia esculenta TaxID=4460 RepID=A0A843WXV3_COLES|nr:hypothetical protein [Colocasia esculenta]